MRPSEEEIAEKRRQRQAKKAAAAEAAANKPRQFITREFLRLAPATPNRLALKVMSYNILAQALVRRHLFPSSGGAVKWSYRGKVLADEVSFYNCDICCFQEVDVNCDLVTTMKKSGYTTHFHHHPLKRHGLLIAYKLDLFTTENYRFIDFDDGYKLVKLVASTGNVGQILQLKFRPTVVEQYPYLANRSVLVGTTHLYWHPYGCYERSRQTYIVKAEMAEFERTLKVLDPQLKCFKVFAGDFNLEPFDPPYHGIVKRGSGFIDHDSRLLSRSINYFANGIEPEEKEEGEMDGEEDEEPTQANGTKDGEPPIEPIDPEPLIAKLQGLHWDPSTLVVVSAYSQYSLVDPDNAQDNGEPHATNWAHAWRGLLDYVFLMTREDEDTQMKVLELLRIPTPKELGGEGLPQHGKFPSDHICIAANIELK